MTRAVGAAQRDGEGLVRFVAQVIRDRDADGLGRNTMASECGRVVSTRHRYILEDTVNGRTLDLHLPFHIFQEGCLQAIPLLADIDDQFI